MKGVWHRFVAWFEYQLEPVNTQSALAVPTPQIKPDKLAWEPDFPPFPARVSYFIATGKIVSHQQIASALVSRVTVTMSADASKVMMACALTSEDIERFTRAMRKLQRPWFTKPKVRAYIALWSFIAFGILSWVYFIVEAKGWL